MFFSFYVLQFFSCFAIQIRINSRAYYCQLLLFHLLSIILTSLKTIQPRHSERSEESLTILNETLHFVQGDTFFVLQFFGSSVYSGIFPCFLGGRDSRLFNKLSRAVISFGRVSCGSITSSIYPRHPAPSRQSQPSARRNSYPPGHAYCTSRRMRRHRPCG